jgi:hypothetical protein
MAAVDNGKTIEIGDIVGQATDDARACSDTNWTYTTLAQTQEDFIDDFLGVAMQGSASASTTPIRVATSGVFEFACANTTYELGDLVGPDANAGGTAMMPQQVEKVTDASRAIGRVAKRYGSATSVLLVDIVSSIMKGGAQQEQASA